MNIDILDFLMKNDVIIENHKTGLNLTADELYRLGGEFIVYRKGTLSKDGFRTTDFDEALKLLNGEK